MKYSGLGILTAALVLVSHSRAAVASEAESSFTTRTVERAKIAGNWLVWYDEAPAYSQPFLKMELRTRRLDSGTTFSCEVVARSFPSGIEWLRVRVKGVGAPWWIPIAYCRHPVLGLAGDLPIGQEALDAYVGLHKEYRPSDLTALPEKYTTGGGPRLRREAAVACAAMLDAATSAGFRVRVLSGYRSAAMQSRICRAEVHKDGLRRREVERPGHSEHQLGTAVDLTRTDELYELSQKFESTPEAQWLQANAARFGFVMTYTRARTERDGFPFEPWHFRYVGVANVPRFAENTKRQ
jgi:D-alanyl-D-alanine dipeptidase